MKPLSNEFIGYELSNATMKPEDLIPEFMDFLETVAEQCEIQDEVAELQKEVDQLEFEEKPGYGTYYTEESNEQADWILNEDIWDLLNDIAPEFCYFGTHEGDGACYGFWTSDEALADAIEAQLQEIVVDPWTLDTLREKLESITQLLEQHNR